MNLMNNYILTLAYRIKQISNSKSFLRSKRFIWSLNFLGIFHIIGTYDETSAQVIVIEPALELINSEMVDQDDMCIWIHPDNRSLSTIISSDKDADKLFVYDLSGNLLQEVDVDDEVPGNIDIRYNFPLGGQPTDIVGYNRRDGSEIVIYKVDPSTRELSFVGNFESFNNYGFCLYKSPVTGKYYGFISDNSSDISQYELSDDNNDGIIECTLVRQMSNGSGNTEGMVADDETGILYAGNENDGIYKFDAEPDSSTNRVLVAQTGTNGLTSNVEGLTIYYAANGEGYLIASSQGSDDYKIYERKAPHNFIKTVGITGVGVTDGIDVTNVSLGTAFPFGIFLAHDGTGVHDIAVCLWEDFILDIDTAYWNPRNNNFAPDPPSNLAAATISQTQIDLVWTDNSDNEGGFRIERKLSSGGTYNEIATVTSSVTIYQDITLTSNTEYCYRVRAYNTSGNSEYSNEDCAATNPIPGFSGHWKLDEGSGTTIIDASGSGNDGAVIGSPVWVTGIDGQALDLDGTNDYALVADDASLDIVNAITLAAWIKPEEIESQSIIKKAILGTTNGYELSLSHNGRAYFRINEAASGDTYRINATSSYPIDGNTWMHIACTYDGTNIRIYVNGVENAIEVPCTISISENTLDLGIGAQPDGSDRFQGTLDDLQVYSFALSDSQILSLATFQLEIPILDSPEDGALEIVIPPTLTWFESANATSYQLQVSTNYNFSSIVFDQGGISETSYLAAAELTINTTYYWRVRSSNSIWMSEWSAVWSFTTSSEVSNGAGFTVNFDGTSDYVVVPDNISLDLGASATIEAWIKPLSAGTQRIVFKLDGSNGYEFFLSSSGSSFPRKVSFRINDGARINSTTLYPTNGTWIHVAATYNGTYMNLFINGIQEGGNVSSANIGTTNTSDLIIGRDPQGMYYFNGAIDEVRIWNVARSINDIRTNMCRKLSGSENGLVGYWRFDETNSNIMSDKTGLNHGNLFTDFDGNEHSWSGAPLGDASAYDYNGTDGYSTFLSSTDGDDITAATTSGTITGIQVYRVDDNSFRNNSTVPAGFTVSPERYWGVKVIGSGSPTYSLVYNYEGHPGFIDENALELVRRDNIADNSWEDAAAILNIALNTLTTAGTGTEYALATTAVEPLPVELNSFSAAVIREGIKLKWQTQTEVSNYGFEIERNDPSPNPLPGGEQKGWVKIGFVEGHGNSNSPKNYSFIDVNVTAGKYAYRLKQIDTDGKFEYSKIIEINFGSAAKFELSQNYPNPFNPVTTISFSVPEASEVKLTIYNILGEEVASLVNGFKETGVHTVDFNASQFNSGFYIYRLEAGKFVQVKKMMLVK